MLIDEKIFIKSKFFKAYLLTKKEYEIVNKKREKYFIQSYYDYLNSYISMF
ncbi:hypothetical protein GCM10022397_40420 [Flavivirga jejuensis]